MAGSGGKKVSTNQASPELRRNPTTPALDQTRSRPDLFSTNARSQTCSQVLNTCGRQNLHTSGPPPPQGSQCTMSPMNYSQRINSFQSRRLVPICKRVHSDPLYPCVTLQYTTVIFHNNVSYLFTAWSSLPTSRSAKFK